MRDVCLIVPCFNEAGRLKGDLIVDFVRGSQGVHVCFVDDGSSDGTWPLLERLRDLADVEAAERAALRALARRGHARRDLQRRLVKKQHPPRAVDAALERLGARGLLDDRRFAEQYAGLRATRGRGPARLLRDLLAQGVERRTAEEAVRRALDEESIDPALEARAVAVKRARQLGGLPPVVRRRRLLAFLVRRGYAGPQIRALVEELCG